MFRWWWAVRPWLLLPLVNHKLSAIVGISSTCVALAAHHYTRNTDYPECADAGWILTNLAFLSGIIFFADLALRYVALRYLDEYCKGIRAGDFTEAPIVLPQEYRFAAPANMTEEQLYPYIDLSNRALRIRSANPELTPEARLSLYQSWYTACPSGFLHLEKRIGSGWRPIAVAIVLPIDWAANAAIRSIDVSKRIKIVDLPTSNIKSSLSADAECLLIDTWIVDKSFQGSGHGKTRAHGGYGNSLVLRAIARFWNAASRSLNVTFLIETNSSALMNVLAGLAFKGAGTSKIGADFYEVNKRTLRGMILDSYKRLLQKINALTAVPIADCTVPKPTDWPQ